MTMRFYRILMMDEKTVFDDAEVMSQDQLFMIIFLCLFLISSGIAWTAIIIDHFQFQNDQLEHDLELGPDDNPYCSPAQAAVFDLAIL